MTAPQPYSICEEKNRTDSAVCEKGQLEASLQECIDEVLFEIYVLSGSLGTVGELMLNADVKCDSVAVGEIIEHYTELISESLGRIEECLN